MPTSTPDTTSQTIIGIDPGTNVMGFAIIATAPRTKPRLVDIGVLRLNSRESHYARLRHIYDHITDMVTHYRPTHFAIEAPFFGKNVQSMLKLGRAQGVAIAAALAANVEVVEYEPRKVKMAVTGNGAASKEQLRTMLQMLMDLSGTPLPDELDATDALGVALCHHIESTRPMPRTSGASSWKDFVLKNPDRVR